MLLLLRRYELVGSRRGADYSALDVVEVGNEGFVGLRCAGGGSVLSIVCQYLICSLVVSRFTVLITITIRRNSSSSSRSRNSSVADRQVLAVVAEGLQSQIAVVVDLVLEAGVAGRQLEGVRPHQMLGEETPTDESRVAHVANVHGARLVVKGAQMMTQVLNGSNFVIAAGNAALVRQISPVKVHVNSQVVDGFGSVAAKLAFVGTIGGMLVLYMVSHGGRVGAGHLAQRTLVVVHVIPDVVLEQTLGRKSSRAVRALEGVIFSFYLTIDVVNKLNFIDVEITARRAAVLALFSMSSQMITQLESG